MHTVYDHAELLVRLQQESVMDLREWDHYDLPGKGKPIMTEMIIDAIERLHTTWGVPLEIQDALREHYEYNYSERRRLATRITELEAGLDFDKSGGFIRMSIEQFNQLTTQPE